MYEMYVSLKVIKEEKEFAGYTANQNWYYGKTI